MPEVIDNWDAIADWWRREAKTDPTYDEDVRPLLEDLTPDEPGTVLELGCGEGQWLRWMAADGVRRLAEVVVG